MSILDCGRQNDLQECMQRCASVADLDPRIAVKAAKAAIRAAAGLWAIRSDHAPVFDLETRWYTTLANGSPDYSVYTEPYYFCDLWACWVQYSRRYLKMIEKDKARYGSPRTVIDLGCGFGYTTAALKEIFPDATVYGTNVPSTSQWALAKLLGQDYDFYVISNNEFVTSFPSVVFASEYFEHFESPLAELQRVLIQHKPEWLIVANAFTGRAIGHFNEYFDLSGQRHIGKQMGRLFSSVLKNAGYTMQRTTYWNRRPAVWLKSK